MKPFPSPHVHPASLDSASTLEQFALREIELGTGVLTVTDHGTMAATRAAYTLARDKKRLSKLAGRPVDPLVPILGIEAYLRDDDCPILLGAGHQKGPDGTLQHVFKYGHLLVHFLDRAAYDLGVRLLTHADLERGGATKKQGSERKPLFTWRDLEELGAANTTISSGCLVGAVCRHLKERDDYEAALAYYDRLRSICRPGRFLVEVFPHRCDKNWVQGVFVDFSDGTRVRFPDWKKLRTTWGDFGAEEFYKRWARTPSGELNDAPPQLLAVMEQRVWHERDPRFVVAVKRVEDYMDNEPCAWAPDGDLQAGLNRFMLEVAAHFGDRVVISDDAHYAHPEERVVQDVRLGAGSGGGWRFYGSYHRLASAEAFDIFRATLGTTEVEFERWVDNSREWASWFGGLDLSAKPELPTSFYPGDSLERTLELITNYGRLDQEDEAQMSRLQQEIAVLHDNGVVDLLPYFFPVTEVVHLYEGHGFLTGPGRGSAAGLLLAYLLGITHVDPLRYGLSLERFITPDRIKSGKLPDIDQDLPHRDLLVDPADWRKGWLRERFGDCVVQISTISKLRLRSAVKDVHRAMHGRVPPEIEVLAERMRVAPQGVSDHDFVFGYTSDTGEEVGGTIDQDPALIEYVKRYPREWEVVQKAMGLGRQRGRHACAYGIANRPVGEIVPLTEVGGVGVTSFPAEGVEAAGIVKYDFLCLNSLKDITLAVRLLQRRTPPPAKGLVLGRRHVPAMRLVPVPGGGWVDVWDPPEDQAVFAEVAAGKTETVFQFNTAAARKWLRHFNHDRPDGRGLISSVPDMSVFTSLERPGPLDVMLARPEDCEACGSTRKVDGAPCVRCCHNALVEYARRARGLSPSKDIPPLLEKLLPETYGVLVTQEQLQYTFQHLAGCTGAQAEEFRRNVAKKDGEKVRAWFEPFTKGVMATTGASEKEAHELWAFYGTWAQYGFNLSHATCYALIGYVCAWLKHHYPLEWWCAVLSHADKNEVCETFWGHVGHMILLPEVSASGEVWEIQGGKLRAPLSLLDGVGEAAHAELVSGRPYENIEDLVRHVAGVRAKKAKAYTDKKGQARVRQGQAALHRGVVYKLIAAGALDSLFPPETLLLDKLSAYEDALARVFGKKKEPVKKEYLKLDSFARYQLRKTILPVYGEDLRPLVSQCQIEGVSWSEGRGYWVRGRNVVPVVGERDLHLLQDTRPESLADAVLTDEQGVVRVAVAAYVQSVEQFAYGPGKRKKATKWLLEVAGNIAEYVQWPRSTRPAQPVSDAPAGSIVFAALTKLGSDLVVDQILQVRAPLGEPGEPSHG